MNHTVKRITHVLEVFTDVRGSTKEELKQAVAKMSPGADQITGEDFEFPTLPKPPPTGGKVCIVDVVGSDIELQHKEPEIVIELRPAKALFGPITVEVGMNYADMEDTSKPYPFEVEKSTYDGFIEGMITTLSVLAKSGVQINTKQLERALPRLIERAQVIATETRWTPPNKK